MKLGSRLGLALAIALALASVSALALAHDDGAASLFINMTTDDPHRASMALSFGGNQLDRGHPVTFFLNDRGVLVASKSNAERFAEHHAALALLIEKGATVIVCPMCMRHYGVAVEDLLDGLLVGNPELTGEALFRENTRTLTW